MSIYLQDNKEIEEIVVKSLSNKNIDIKNVSNLKVYFDTVLNVISYTGFYSGEAIKSNIYI